MGQVTRPLDPNGPDLPLEPVTAYAMVSENEAIAGAPDAGASVGNVTSRQSNKNN